MMTDPKERTKIFNWAISLKWKEFTWSGLVLVGTGLIIVFFGIRMQMGPYSPEGIVVGFGAILIIIGIIRLLIGFINPRVPHDLHTTTVPKKKDPREEIFKS